MRGAGSRGERRADTVAAIITASPRNRGAPRTPPRLSNTTPSWANEEPAARVAGEVIPRMMSIWEISIMPPIPQEKPVTTACGTRVM